MVWYEIYKELTKQLFIFQKTHSKDPGRILYLRCIKHKSFAKEHHWIRKFTPRSIERIDPIHFFASFNEPRLTNKRRTEKVLSWYEIFSLKQNITEIDFSGCPTPVVISLLSVRKEEDQNQIWDVFQNVMTKQQEALDPDVFDNVKKWYGIDIPSFTMFLFWMSPKNFLPLDKNTTRLLILAGLIKRNRLRHFEEYKRLIKFKESQNYIDIARTAVELLDDSTKMLEYTMQLNTLYHPTSRTRRKVKESDFRLIGFKLLKGTLKKYHKNVLELERVYGFYDQFVFLKDGSINCDELSDVRLYSRGGLNINISAIVGKNGAGKSTIAEILYAGVYNVACKFSKEYEGLKSLQGLNLELYYLEESIFKILIRGSSIRVYRYTKKGAGYLSPKLLKKKEFKLEQFFYTVAINYSFYGLNEFYLGEWISELFHKNDGYQVPITLSPFRRNGNIDINTEDNLVTSRLIANVLEPVSNEVEDNMRKLTEDGRFASHVKFAFNNAKLSEIEIERKNWSLEDLKKVLNKVYEIFEIRSKHRNIKLREAANNYLYRKLLKIPKQYTLYRKYQTDGNLGENEQLLTEYLNAIKNDPSHVTYKFIQAVNFLKHNDLFNLPLNKYINIEKLSTKIDEIKSFSGNNESKTIEFVPPSFYKPDIRLDDNSDFRDLSSGEKQRIYVASSLVYHLNNLSSIVNPDLVCYSNVNIIFDEIELYFHPNMQRTFLTYLLNYLNMAGFQNIYGLNFCFITHSPFILSDIPFENILFLKKKDDKSPENVTLKTFGANIHELLMDGFFMQQTLGEFALKQIEDILAFHQEVKENDSLKISKLREEYSKKKNKFYFVRDSLGEIYIRNIIENHINEIEEILGENTFIEKQIHLLEEDILKLKQKRNAKN